MTHRSFQDRDGSHWDVWDVYPIAERRSVVRRQRVERGSRLVERRRLDDRRQLRSPRAQYNTEYAAGWLCFENGTVRRRFAPVPAGWEAWDADRLSACCRAATPVHKRMAG